MSRTTIEIPSDLRDKLKAERKPHESNYGETIERLLNDSDGGQLWTKREIQDVVQREMEQHTRR